MNKDKKKIAVIVFAAITLMFVCIIGVIIAHKTTSDNKDINSEITTSAGLIEYTVPERPTVQNENSISFAKPESSVVTSAESKFTFSGKCDGNYDLFCNGTRIPYSELGVFSCEVTLSQGINSVQFTYGSVKKSFTVEYGIDIVRQVSPLGKTEATPGTAVEILALGHKDAQLFAMIGDRQIPLTATDRNAFQQSEGTRDYVTFAGVFTMPSGSGNISLGNITVVGTHGGKTVQMSGGEVFLIADNTAIIAKAAQLEQLQNLTSYYAGGTRNLLTPYSDNGYGTSMLCEVLKDKAETTPASEPNDYSSPLYTPLPKGTFDYVAGMVTYDDELMYILTSGRKIYAKDAKLLSPGYSLPENTVSAAGVSVNHNTTDFFISTNWMVPIGTALLPQPYYTGYQGRIYNVSGFTAEYLDVVFYHTTGFAQPFDLPENDVFSAVQWINNSDGTVTLRCYLAMPGKFYGYSVSLTENGLIKLSVKNRNAASQKTVILDPGHGGSDPGALGAYDGVREAPINLILASKVAAILQGQGVNVILSRTGDADVSLNDRMLMSRNYMPDAFVSIHCDSSTSASSNGTHTFYYESFSMPLAASIHAQMVSVYKNNIYRPGTDEYNNADKGIKFFPFQIARVEECPSVLVECGFLSNAVDCSILCTEACQNALAMAIANGILIYLNEIR